MKKYLEILKKCPLFYNIDGEDIEKMLHCLGAKVDTFDKKYTIFREGDPAKYLGIVLSGEVQVTQTDYFGNRTILSNMGVSELFAEAFAAAGTTSMPVSVIASEKSEIMFIDCNHILHTCKNGCSFHHQLIFNLMKDLADKAVMFQQRIEIISKRTTREKLLSYLMACSKNFGTNSFVIPFDRQELADFLGVDRSGLSVEISKLKKEGVIDSHRSRFKLL
ncbi:MAG: Crp/Fnr family transcriptional regulator [Clostridia bacterium]|nr:Crp/Fnr family transcriptional regulator [Clostridia bacterium]